jgi:predicted dehydrogenase
LHVLQTARCQPLAQAIKEAVDEGKLGGLRFGHFTSMGGWLSPEKGIPPSHPTTWEMFLFEHAVETLDFAGWLFDTSKASVFARGCWLEQPNVPECAHIVLYLGDGSQIVCEVGRTASLATGSGLQHISLIGLRGNAQYDARKIDVVLGSGGSRYLSDDPLEGLTQALTRWVTAAGPDPATGIREAKITLALSLAAAESIRSGQPVSAGGEP